MLSMTSSNAVAAPVDDIEKIVRSDCVAVIDQRLHIDNAPEMASVGYVVQPPDNEGLWASKQLGNATILIGTAPGKPGCRLRFSGSSAGAIYEALVQRFLDNGFTFSGGSRKPAEPQFIMDTLVAEKGPIGIVSMFRMNTNDTSAFAVTVFPTITPSKR